MSGFDLIIGDPVREMTAQVVAEMRQLAACGDDALQVRLGSADFTLLLGPGHPGAEAQDWSLAGLPVVRDPHWEGPPAVETLSDLMGRPR